MSLENCPICDKPLLTTKHWDKDRLKETISWPCEHSVIEYQRALLDCEDRFDDRIEGMGEDL